jgi:glucose-1-phosphatase
MMFWRKLFLLLAALWFAATGQVVEAMPQDAFHSKYHLAQVIVLSRHNIRAPLANAEKLGKITEHQWHDFGVKGGELTAHGAQIEEKMGAYCRLYFQKEELFPVAYQPEARDILFYANAFQRTIATARSFETGMFPDVDVPVRYNGNVNDADPVFLPGQGGHRAPFDEKLTEELAALGGESALTQSVAAGVKTAAAVLDNAENGAGEFR